MNLLKLFQRAAAREAFSAYVAAGMNLHYPDDLDSPAEGYILGSDEFVDETIHRIGDTPRRRSEHTKAEVRQFDAAKLISAVAQVFGLSSEQFCGPEKTAKAILAKETLILIGREQGATVNQLSLIAGLDTSNISRRCDAARQRLDIDRKLRYAKSQVEKIYLGEGNNLTLSPTATNL